MTIFEAYNSAKKRLEAAGIEDYVFEAKQIIKHITGFAAAQILANYNKPLTEFQQNNLTVMLHQREIRYPLQYIFGEWDFYGRSFAVGPGVLIPRSDTETVVEHCIEFLSDKESPSVLDLCTGSGCIGITIGLEKADSAVLAVERYDEALRYAEKNIQSNSAENVRLLKGDIFEGVGSDGEYTLIVSNPPYIPQSEMETVSPEVEFEPRTALEGGSDGLDFYRAIIDNYKASLRSGGMLCFEVGINEYASVSELLKCAGFKDIKVKKDLGGIERAVSGIK